MHTCADVKAQHLGLVKGSRVAGLGSGPVVHLFQILQRRLEFLHERAHASKCRALQLLATVQRVTELEQTEIVLANPVDEPAGHVELAESKLVMVAIVQHVHQIGIEGMDVVKFWETINDSAQFFIHSFLHEFNLAHIELSDALDFESLRDNCRRFALSFTQDDVNEVVSLGNFNNLLKVVATLN